MPIDVEFCHEGLGVICNCHGAVSIQDFIGVKTSLLASPDKLKKVRYGVIDHTSMEKLTLDFQSMVGRTQDRRLAAIIPSGALCAVSAPTDLGYGLSRMWEALSEQSGWEIEVFRSRAEADRWIQHRVKEKFGIDLTNIPIRP